MQRTKVKSIGELLQAYLRQEGLETPLAQHRVLDEWNNAVGPGYAHYVSEMFIRNQTLHVFLKSPALRQNLMMRRTELVRELNRRVGMQVITDIQLH